MPSYLIHGQRLEPEDSSFQEALAAAHASRHRPLCMCRAAGLEMYVARVGSGFVLKRMPDTGGTHAPECASYEPPPELSGLGELKGTAIVEDTTAGVTSLKLDFALSRGASRSITPAAGDGGDSVASDGSRLTMRGLLHYLWDQGELTRWQPSFAGRRSWAVVRKQLLMAAHGKVARSRPLQDQLYVPEPFTVERRDEINARRLARWSCAVGDGPRTRSLLLLVGEVKEIVPARFGYKAVIKHLPDQVFMLDESIFRRMSRRFEPELSWWGASEELHMVMMATFGVAGGALVPTIDELTLMTVNSHWLPVTDPFEQQLVDRLVREGRSFVKALRYNLAADRQIASVVLTDTRDYAVPLFVMSHDEEGEPRIAPAPDAWIWRPHQEPMPALPTPGRRVRTEVEPLPAG